MRFMVTILMASLVAIAASAAPARAAEVALGESGGIYTVTGEINRSVALQFLVDPGSAVVVIPRAALSRLVANGSVSEADVVGVSIAELADRSLHQTARIRLRELRIGNEVARDIIAAVSPGLSHALLGQSFFKRFASVTLDNRRRVMILTGQGPEDSGFVAAAPQYPATSSQYPTTTPSPYYGRPPAASYGPYGLQPIQRAGLLDAEALIRPRCSRSKKPRADPRGAFASCEAVGLVAVIIAMTPGPLVAAAVIAVIPAPVVAPAVRHAAAPMVGMKAAPAAEGGFNDVCRSARDAEIRNRGSRVGGHRRDAQSQSAGDKKS